MFAVKKLKHIYLPCYVIQDAMMIVERTVYVSPGSFALFLIYFTGIRVGQCPSISQTQITDNPEFQVGTSGKPSSQYIFHLLRLICYRLKGD